MNDEPLEPESAADAPPPGETGTEETAEPTAAEAAPDAASSSDEAGSEDSPPPPSTAGGAPPTTPPGAAPEAGAGQPHEERMWAMACHLSGLAGFLIPFGNILAPLILWLVLREKWPFVDDQGKEALNFQITMTFYVLAACILIFFCIGIPILIGLMVLDLVLVIVAAIRSSEGVGYRYPLTLRLVQ